jgi:hypothetical protein
VTWSIVMVENPIIGSKFRPFSTHGTFFFVWIYFHSHSCDTETSIWMHYIPHFFSIFIVSMETTFPWPTLNRLCHSKTLYFSYFLPHKPRGALYKSHLDSFFISHTV